MHCNADNMEIAEAVIICSDCRYIGLLCRKPSAWWSVASLNITCSIRCISDIRGACGEGKRASGQYRQDVTRMLVAPIRLENV